MKNKALIILTILTWIYSHGYSQDFRDNFVGNYLCDVQTFSGGSSTWDTATLNVTKSDTNLTQVVITRSLSQYSIATVDTVGHFVVSSNPYGEWGDFYVANDSLYYFINGGSAMGLYFYYYGKKVVTSSVNDHMQTNSSIVLYPNPANDKLYLSFKYLDDKSFVSIYDLKGQLVYNKSINQTDKILEIDIKGIPKGLYLLNLSSKSNLFSSKFLKQ